MNGVRRSIDEVDILGAKDLLSFVAKSRSHQPAAEFVAASEAYTPLPKKLADGEESLSGRPDNDANDSSGSYSSLDDTTSTPPPAKKRKTVQSGNNSHVHDPRLRAFSRSLHRGKPSRDQADTTPTGEQHPNSADKDDASRRHENGVPKLIEEPPMTTGHHESRMTASSPSPSVEQRGVIDSNRSDHVNIDNNNTMMAMMAKTDSVYFGWIRHPATKAWRDTVKVFSQNHREFPSWSDDICEKMRAMLRQEKQIEHFYICRRNPNENPTGSGSAEKQKKIFDKQKNYMGKWYHATEQEILDRTKQRFVDDRKPQAMVTGAKRPRGRPPKTVSREASLDVLESHPKSAKETIMSLHPLLLKWNQEFQRLDAVDKRKELTVNGATPESGDKSALKPHATAVADMTIEPSKLVEVMADIDRMQMHVRNELETALSHSAAVDSALTKLIKVEVKTGTPSENSSKEDKSNQDNLSVPSRTAWFPVMSNNVCFDWNQHSGTVKWRETVTKYSNNVQEYAEWTSAIADLVKDELSGMGCEVFLVFLNSEGNPSESIHDGLWYVAGDDVFVTRTKEEFQRLRGLVTSSTQ